MVYCLKPIKTILYVSSYTASLPKPVAISLILHRSIPFSSKVNTEDFYSTVCSPSFEVKH